MKNNWFKELVITIVQALSLVLVVHTVLVKPFSIPSPSMVPTLLVGDYLFVNKFAYGYSKYSIPFSPELFQGRLWGSQPERGDVIVFRPPHRDFEDWVKRVIGLPGDRIRVIEGIVTINDKPVVLENLGPYEWYDQFNQFFRDTLFTETLPNGVKHYILKGKKFGEGLADNTKEFIVPEGHLFVMGDNRDQSHDSRFSDVGFIPQVNLVGRAEIIFFSTDLPTHNGAFWMFWRWPTATRYSRFLTLIR